MPDSRQSANADAQAKHRRGVKRQLDQIQAELAELRRDLGGRLNFILAERQTVLAERQAEQQKEQRQ